MMRAILFDLDETLHDRTASLDWYLTDLYDRCQPSGPLEAFKTRFRELDQNGYADKAAVFGVLQAEFGLTASVAELVADVQQNAWKAAQTFSGTERLLKELRARGYKLGIVTNGAVATQTSKLQALGLLDLVDVVLISEQEGVRKPDPCIFQRAAERLGVGIRECIFVGDHPEYDIQGAQQAGMTGVWMRHSAPWPDSCSGQPNYTIGCIEELLAIVL